MVELAISVITDEFSEEFDEVCEFLAKQDVNYVELRNVWLGNVVEVDDQTIHDAKDVIDENGLKVSCIAGPLLKCIPPSVNPEPKNATSYSENWKYNFSKIDRAIEVANIMDCKYIRCFGFNGKFKVPDHSEWNNWQIYKEWQDALNDMKEKARKHNKMLICENEGGLNKSLQDMEKIAKDNCDDVFGLLYDMANVANKYYKKGVLTDEWLGRIGKYIQYIHAKGCKRTGTTYVNDKKDICRWPQVVKYFKEQSNDYFVQPAPEPLFCSIETHMGKKDKWAKSEQSLNNLKELLN